jgi:hypothetical protein
VSGHPDELVGGAATSRLDGTGGSHVELVEPFHSFADTVQRPAKHATARRRLEPSSALGCACLQ